MSRPITTQDFRNRLQTASMNQRPNYNSSPQRAPIQQNMPAQPLKDTMGNELVVYNRYILKNFTTRPALNGQSAQYKGNNTFVIGPNKIEIPQQGNITLTPDPNGGRKRRRFSRKVKRTNRRKLRRTRRR